MRTCGQIHNTELMNMYKHSNHSCFVSYSTVQTSKLRNTAFDVLQYLLFYFITNYYCIFALIQINLCCDHTVVFRINIQYYKLCSMIPLCLQYSLYYCSTFTEMYLLYCSCSTIMKPVSPILFYNI